MKLHFDLVVLVTNMATVIIQKYLEYRKYAFVKRVRCCYNCIHELDSFSYSHHPAEEMKKCIKFLSVHKTLWKFLRIVSLHKKHWRFIRVLVLQDILRRVLSLYKHFKYSLVFSASTRILNDSSESSACTRNFENSWEYSGCTR